MNYCTSAGNRVVRIPDRHGRGHGSVEDDRGRPRHRDYGHKGWSALSAGWRRCFDLDPAFAHTNNILLNNCDASNILYKPNFWFSLRSRISHLSCCLITDLSAILPVRKEVSAVNVNEQGCVFFPPWMYFSGFWWFVIRQVSTERSICDLSRSPQLGVDSQRSERAGADPVLQTGL